MINHGKLSLLLVVVLPSFTITTYHLMHAIGPSSWLFSNDPQRLRPCDSKSLTTAKVVLKILLESEAIQKSDSN